MMRDYTKIDAWKLADDVAVAVYELTRLLPREEIYGMTSQLRRAAVSVASNIAEGSARDSKRDYLHFLYIARGSLTEVQYLIHLAGRLAYLNAEIRSIASEQVQNAFRCLHGLIRSVEREAGKLVRAMASITSLLVIGFARLSADRSILPDWAL